MTSCQVNTEHVLYRVDAWLSEKGQGEYSIVLSNSGSTESNSAQSNKTTVSQKEFDALKERFANDNPYYGERIRWHSVDQSICYHGSVNNEEGAETITIIKEIFEEKYQPATL